MFYVLIQIVTRQPVLVLRFEQTETCAVKKFEQIFHRTFRKWTLAFVTEYVIVAPSVHPFVCRHSKTRYLKMRLWFLTTTNPSTIHTARLNNKNKIDALTKARTHLIQLTNEQHENPHAVEKCVRGYPSHPSIALTDRHNKFPITIRGCDVTGTLILPKDNGTVEHLTAHHHQARQKTDKIFMILST
jgi:hypothetical protein